VVTSNPLPSRPVISPAKSLMLIGADYKICCRLKGQQLFGQAGGPFGRFGWPSETINWEQPRMTVRRLLKPRRQLADSLHFAGLAKAPFQRSSLR